MYVLFPHQCNKQVIDKKSQLLAKNAIPFNDWIFFNGFFQESSQFLGRARRKYTGYYKGVKGFLDHLSQYDGVLMDMCGF